MLTKILMILHNGGWAVYWNIFKNSLILPKKEALFFLNRVPMGKTILYILVLMHLTFLPNLFKVTNSTFQQIENISFSLYIINVIVLYPFFTILLMILSLTVFSFIALVLAKFLNRKLAYPYLWKITAYSLTVPLIIYAVLEILSITNSLLVIVPILYLYFVLYKIICIYPKKQRTAGRIENNNLV